MKTSVVSNEQEFTESMAEAMSRTQNKEPKVSFWPVNSCSFLLKWAQVQPGK